MRLIVAYDGTEMAGWQRQSNTSETVQEKLEGALAQIVRQPVRAIAAGRTDAGVHALGQVVHVRLPKGAATPPPTAALCRSLVLGTNSFLPPAVRVLRADEVREDFHARKAARSKVYRFCWLRGQVAAPQRARYLVAVERDLDVPAMRSATRSLVGRFDWSAFARSGGAHKSAVRSVTRVDLLEQGADLVLEVEGEGFLRGMVRAMAGTLLEIGRGQRDSASLPELLAGGERAAAGPSAPARGLTLLRVDYAEEWLPTDPSQGFPPLG